MHAADSPDNARQGPLTGLKVVELGQLIAGPFAAKTLADFGAEVIKIEPPGSGDPLRQWRLLHNGTSVWWQVQSRNKLSVALDLKDADSRDIVRRLIAEADVLVENFKPGVMEDWGLGYEALSQDNPGLVMLRISGYGQSGPYRDRPGFGVVAEAMGGLRHLTAEPGRVPVRVGVSIGDTLASLHGVIGILMALQHRHATVSADATTKGVPRGSGSQVRMDSLPGGVGYISPVMVRRSGSMMRAPVAARSVSAPVEARTSSTWREGGATRKSTREGRRLDLSSCAAASMSRSVTPVSPPSTTWWTGFPARSRTARTCPVSSSKSGSTVPRSIEMAWSHGAPWSAKSVRWAFERRWSRR